MPPRNRLFWVPLLLIICTKPCDGIGNWGKKTIASENDMGNDSGNGIFEIDANMEKTYLDLFGESAKEFLTQKVPAILKSIFPATDDDCRWDWRYVRCEPYCECSFQPKLPGDFHLGRACRKRNHLTESFEDEIAPFESTDDVYEEYCVMKTNGDFAMQSTPPPPSIPSPFPFIAKNGKTTWNMLRTKADPVIEKAVDEFEVLQSRVQSVVCQDLESRCDNRGSSNEDIRNSSVSTEFAWQERLFCGDIVRKCTSEA